MAGFSANTVPVSASGSSGEILPDGHPVKKIMEEYLKKRRYMFTRWTDVNLTKELGAKVSLEVYS